MFKKFHTKLMWMKFCLTSEEILCKDWGNFCPYSAQMKM